MSVTLGTAALIAALAGGYLGANAGGAAAADSKNKQGPHKYSGWAMSMAKNTSNPELAQWFRNKAGSNSYLNSLSDQELGAILDQYYYQSGGGLGNTIYSFDLSSALQDLNTLNNINLNTMPQAPDWDAINAEAADRVAKENAQINEIYDANLARQIDAYNTELMNNNQVYNDYARQILSNDYQKNAQLMSGLGNSLDKARMSALEAGASAGLRLSNNINTLLSTQNKQAQQSLETANNLAGQMLAQRQAAAGIRSNYNNTLTNDANNRADLIRGNAERTTAYQNNLTNQYQNTYDRKMTSWENSNSRYSSNPFYGSYMGYTQNNAYNTNKQGGNK